MSKIRYLHWLFNLIAVWSLATGALMLDTNGYAATAQSAACGSDCVRVEAAAAPESAKPFDWKWVLTTLGSLAAFVISVWTNRRLRQATTDSKVLDRRFDRFADLIRLMAPLAIYFPTGELRAGSANVKQADRKIVKLNQSACIEMGKAASQWYFSEGGILMSGEARDAFMLLQRGLTMAARAKTLRVPDMPNDSALISADQLSEYRALLFDDISAEAANGAQERPALPWYRTVQAKLLERLDDDDAVKTRKGHSLASVRAVASYKFDLPLPPHAKPHQRFRDYVLLQNLSSKLRTALAEDLRSRRRPE